MSGAKIRRKKFADLVFNHFVIVLVIIIISMNLFYYYLNLSTKLKVISLAETVLTDICEHF